MYRIMSFNVPGREDRFRTGKRARDGECVVSGVLNRRAPYDWSVFEEAHIFPLEKENLWIEGAFEQCNNYGYGRCYWSIEIGSCQNGVLLSRSVHGDFDRYLLSVKTDVS